MAVPNGQALLRQRLLSDIQELQQQPYPGITLHFQDEDALQRACLVLSPPGRNSLHLTIHFGDSYPLNPPNVTIQSVIDHPNVFNEYICASILNTEEGYTSAYTLKGICIQLLSFFSSDTIEQMHGDGVINLNQWQEEGERNAMELVAGNPHIQFRPPYQCNRCGFGQKEEAPTSEESSTEQQQDVTMTEAQPPYATAKADAKIGLIDLPNEVLLLVCDYLDEEGLLLAAKAWNGFGRVMRQYNIIHVREMQCFTLKKGFKDATLGVGIHVQGREIQSEFDLVSLEAFCDLDVKRSVQGLGFEYWLPLPISQMHWAYRAKKHVYASIHQIGSGARLNGSPATILYSFLNDVVVRLCREASEGKPTDRNSMLRYLIDEMPAKSTLTHASEKAIESYFHLYHLLLCLAIDNPAVVRDANCMIKDFLDGKRDKQRVPSLGHLLIMVFISDHPVTEDLTKAIIKEAVTRNVVWMLDSKGSGLAELSFLEADAVSEYRLRKTFEAGKTSYRLLMFAKLMQRCVTATASTTDPESGEITELSIQQRCKELFDRHGAPPSGAAATLAEQVRKIQRVNDFPNFLKVMGVQTMPKKDEFTKWLRGTLSESVDKGYSKWALTQQEALLMRKLKEPGVGVLEGMQPAHTVRGRYSFFPEERNRQGGTYRGGRGGRSGRR
jgi:ubiquitin-protein ligase